MKWHKNISNSRAAGMDDFPIWVQLLAKVLFTVIVAREGVDYISKESLKQFYEKFAGLTGQDLVRTTEEGFKTATAVSFFLLHTVSKLSQQKYHSRMEITSSTTRATSFCSPTSCWARPSTGPGSICSGFSTTETPLSSTRSSPP